MNAFFQLIGKPDQTELFLFPASDGGKELDPVDVIDYLNFHKINFDLAELNKTVSSYTEETSLVINRDTLIPINEELSITVDDNKMVVKGRFCCASDQGQLITKEEIMSDLKYKGIKYGIDELAIEEYLAKRNYMEDIILAQGKPPVHGNDARIEYFFNTDLRVRPTLKEDGSVDFFNLNIINHIEEGQLLAKLHRETKGEEGIDVFGGRILPRKVAKKILKYGKNIRINDTNDEIYSECNGHVTLVDGRVFVSNVMEVENVDTSTGNIEYEGNVQVNGNVCSNFSIKAKGNVEVKGVVEGAEIEAGGNITIALGMNGMGKGVLKSGGNIVTKFLENAVVEAEGYVESGTIMHSNVVAGTEVHVNGRKAFIAGGKVCATSLIESRVIGSDMGTETVVEIGLSAIKKKRYKEVGEAIGEIDKVLARAIPIMEAAKERIDAGQELSTEQLENVKNIFMLSKIKKEELGELKKEKEELEEMLEVDKDAKVVVTDNVYPGTKIVISDVSKFIKSTVSHCKFTKSQGDVRMSGI